MIEDSPIFDRVMLWKIPRDPVGLTSNTHENNNTFGETKRRLDFLFFVIIPAIMQKVIILNVVMA